MQIGKRDKERKSILMVASTPPPYGGGEIINEVLVQGLRLKGSFHIIHLDAGDSRGNTNRGKIDFVNVGKGLLDLLQLIRLVLVDKPDIVYIPIAKDFMPFFRDSLHITLASLLGATVVCHLHGGYFELNSGNGLREAFVNFVLKRIDTLVVLGENIKQKLEKRLPVKEFAVLYNGIEPVIQVESQKHSKQDERFHVLFIGNLRESKGLFDILKAASLVLRETDQIDFWFAGEWPSAQKKNHVLDMIGQYEIEEHVKFWGLITGEEKTEFYGRGDVFVLPTYYDGQPIVLLEAMSAGLPIISTDIGSIAETVADNQNGFIIPTGSPDEIAKKILLFHRDNVLRTAMSNMSRKIYEDKFTKEVFLTNAHRVFSEALCREVR